MAIVLRPGKYLIDKTRRHIVGVLAHVGTGGSVPKAVQAALDDYAHSIAAGAGAKEAFEHEKKAIREGMSKMSGSWLILSPSGLRWARGGSIEADIKAVKNAIRNSGWTLTADQVELVVRR